MSDEPKTGLTYWAAGILQPDLIFNDFLQYFGAVGGQPTVKDKDLSAPPGSPAAGDAYIVGPAATGAWAGHENDIAYFDTTWYFFEPSEGWRVDVLDEDLQYRYSGAAWVSQASALLANAVLTGTTNIAEALTLTGDISPTALAADTHNWAPTGFATCSVVWVDQSASWLLGGLAGGADGRVVTLYNKSAHDLLITNEDTGSTAANRFAIGRGLILQPFSGADFYYDGATSRWRILGGRNRVATNYLPADVVNADAVANTLADVTDLKFYARTGKRYRFRFFVAYDAAALTTGSRWSVNGPAFTRLGFRPNWSNGAANSAANCDAYDLPAAAGANSLLTNNISIIEGFIVPSADGWITARFASEVAASAVTAIGGVSHVEYECMN